MRHILVWGLAVSCVGCRINRISRDGPTPVPSAIERQDQGFPTEAVLCTELGGTLKISGEDFSPMPRKVLTDEATVQNPTVTFVHESGTRVPQPDVTYDQMTGTLTVVVSALDVGSYDIEIENPNGNSGSLADGLQIVPPPNVTSVIPNNGANNVVTPIEIAGSDFRRAADATQPAVELTPAGGGTSAALSGVAWISESAVDATVHTGLAVGVYDLTLTNPEGCSSTLPNAFEVTLPPTIELCNSVEPAFGWVDGRTTIEICANNTGGFGLQPVPEAFLIIDATTEVPLIREAFLSASTQYAGLSDASLMSAVVPSSGESRGAGIAVGGPYDIRVVNPDGAQAIISAAFEVLTNPPPRIDAITPEQSETGATVTMTLTGSAFKDPDSALNPRLARVLFLAADLAAGAACATNCYECQSPTWVSATQVTCLPPLSSMASGSYLVRYEHLDDGSFSDFAAFAVTNPAGNLAQTTTPDLALPAADRWRLNQARYAHGATSGKDDLGNRFLYVAGGQADDTVASALDSVEVAAISRFGELTGWTTLPVPLPVKLTGLSLINYGDYLFAVGGSDETGTLHSEIYRARILGDDSAPVILEPQVETSGSLAAGTYTYRVSAAMSAGTDNVNGESLPSDAESIRLTASGSARVRWQAVTGAATYRIYRTPVADDLAGSEVLLAQGISGTDYLDDGSDSPGSQRPRPTGATGEWLPMSSLVVARTNAGIAIAADTSGNDYLYILGGVTSATSPDSTDSYEFAPLTLNAGITATEAFSVGTEALTAPRSEMIATTLSASTAPLISALGKQFIVIAQGAATAGVYFDVNLAEVSNGGELLPFAQADSKANADRYGAASFFANNFLFSIGGRKFTGGFETRGLTIEVCPTGVACSTADPPKMKIAGGDSGITLQTARYRAGGVYVSGFFYFIGGRSDDTTVLDSVERGEYR